MSLHGKNIACSACISFTGANRTFPLRQHAEYALRFRPVYSCRKCNAPHFSHICSMAPSESGDGISTPPGTEAVRFTQPSALPCTRACVAFELHLHLIRIFVSHALPAFRVCVCVALSLRLHLIWVSCSHALPSAQALGSRSPCTSSLSSALMRCLRASGVRYALASLASSRGPDFSGVIDV